MLLTFRNIKSSQSAASKDVDFKKAVELKRKRDEELREKQKLKKRKIEKQEDTKESVELTEDQRLMAAMGLPTGFGGGVNS